MGTIQTINANGKTGYSIKKEWNLTMKEIEMVASLDVYPGENLKIALKDCLSACKQFGMISYAKEIEVLISKIK